MRLFSNLLEAAELLPTLHPIGAGVLPAAASFRIRDLRRAAVSVSSQSTPSIASNSVKAAYYAGTVTAVTSVAASTPSVIAYSGASPVTASTNSSTRAAISTDSAGQLDTAAVPPNGVSTVGVAALSRSSTIAGIARALLDLLFTFGSGHPTAFQVFRAASGSDSVIALSKNGFSDLPGPNGTEVTERPKVDSGAGRS